MPHPASPPQPRQIQRLDKWLWYARVVKTRSLAQKLVRGGNVRIDAKRTSQPGFRIRPGMILTINYASRLRILRVLDPGNRRGSAAQAATLFADLSPRLPPVRDKPPHPANAQREPGAGRPTKKERRQTDQFHRSQVTDWLEFDEKKS